MLLLSQAPGGAVTARGCACAPLKFSHPKQPLFTKTAATTATTNLNFLSNAKPRLILSLAKPDGALDSTTKPSPPFDSGNDTVFVHPDDVPLEGVIQLENSSSSSSTASRIEKWGRVALLSGGDVLALLLFSAFGRFSHGFNVFDVETLRTADPFIAGWFLGAYFLGGYGDDGRGMNGLPKAVIAAAKSWAVGIPLGICIRTAGSGHIPSYTFTLVTMGSTAVVLLGWRALISSFLSKGNDKKDDTYRRGNPFELFELLSSLVRRW